MKRIYLDHSATTPVREEVLEAMLPFLRGKFGNAGSVHSYGREARRAIDDAREQVAAFINADPREIVFTSGGTESDNLAIRGVVAARSGQRMNVVMSSIEHHAVLHAGQYVAKHDGVDLRIVGVGIEGRVDPAEVATRIDEDTSLVSIMHANNETGVIQPIAEIAALCADRKIPFHSDAVQSAGKIPIDVKSIPISLLAISGHKIYAPKGIGACYIRKGTSIAPQALGGFQERERRAGTENVPGIVALGKSCELARVELQENSAKMARLRDTLQAGILEGIPDTRVNGSITHRLPNLVNIAFAGVEGESIILGLDADGIAVSSGAACTSGSLEPSHVLLAMGMSHKDAQSSVRFSLGRGTTGEEIDQVLPALKKLVSRLRVVPNLMVHEL